MVCLNWLLALLCFFLCFLEGKSYEHDLAICAIFRDDARFLPEWIEFHEAQGVTHFYLYNNLSQDHPEVILQKYIASGLVELLDWPFDYSVEHEWTAIQSASYMDCVRRSKRKVRWCAFLDTDEFLFSPVGKLIDILREFHKYSGVLVKWRMYGTSNVAKIPEGEKITDWLLWRAHDEHPAHRTFKTIAKPKNIAGCSNPHLFDYSKGFAVEEDFTPFAGWDKTHNLANKLRINHYWTRDEEFLLTVKAVRRAKWNCDLEKLLNMAALLNQIYDHMVK